ncbi:glycosyltransferase family 4 protein [Mycobacterium sp. SP-6446]|uniref:glycosyltransferase family 4 protein n=1 Tax=Mycobacterium sp. SP-6446 TaxID=1834162 RepID=UPI00158AAA1D|nr:glycosyltransferase family 4 protein [Mycobacterium sp. SP-6446]
MRSLVLVSPFFVPHIGGMERALHRIMIALKRRHWDVSVYTSHHTPQYDDQVPVKRACSTLSEWADSIPAHIRAVDPDRTAVLFASFGPGTGEQQLLAGSEFRERGGLTVWRTPTADHARRNISGQPLQLRRAIDRVVANSRSSQAMTQEIVPEVPVSVIPNLLLEEEVAQHDEDLISPRSADIAWAGRIEPRKQPGLLVEALNLAVRIGKNVVAQPVPSHGNTNLYEQFCGALDKRVETLKPTDGMHRNVARASVFLHISSREGSPNSVLEAASRGQKILVSDIPECRELLTGLEAAAWLHAPRDFEDAFARLLARPDSISARRSEASLIRRRHSEAVITESWHRILTPGGTIG